MRPVAATAATSSRTAGAVVQGVLYRPRLRRFARLDNSEDRQYWYLRAKAEDRDGHRLPIVTFRAPGDFPEGLPDRCSLGLIQEAARQHGFSGEYVAMLNRVGTRD